MATAKGNALDVAKWVLLVLAACLGPLWNMHWLDAEERVICEDGVGEFTCSEDAFAIVRESDRSSEVRVQPDEEFEFAVLLHLRTEDALAFQYGVQHDPSRLEILSVTSDGSDLGFEPDFDVTRIAAGDPAPGFVSGIVFSFGLPVVVPPAENIVVARVRYRPFTFLSPDIGTQLRFSGLLGDPQRNIAVEVSGSTLRPRSVCDAQVRGDEGAADCNFNGIDDRLDVRDGTSADDDGRGVPDECETDCDANGTPDVVEIASGDASDCNSNLVPDGCEVAELDCNRNGLPDDCDLVAELQLEADVSLDAGADARALVLTDLDGDGDQDLSTVHHGSNDVSIFLNDGNARFTESQSLDLGDRPWAIESADFDGDGRRDLAVAHEGEETIALLFNRGEDGFVIERTLELRRRAHAMTIFDVDGDGDTDVVSAAGSSEVALSRNRGNGDFDPPEFFQLEGRAQDPRDIVSLDFDEDGDLDLAVAAERSGHVVLLANDGVGRFTATQEIEAPRATSVLATDLDSDGIPDLVAASNLSAANFPTRVYVFLGLGAGEFEARVEYPTSAAVHGLRAADLNRDTWVDVTVVVSGGIEVLVGDGRGALSPSGALELGRSLRGPALADLDGNGSIDLAVIDGGTCCEFEDSTVLVFSNRSAGPTSIDVNLDGVPDECESRVRFHRSDANADGMTQVSDALHLLLYLFASGAAPSCLEAGDVDNNGVLERADAVLILSYLFLGEGVPAPPGPSKGPCGPDPDAPGSSGDLGCEEYAPCA